MLNPAEMEAALARLDLFDLARTPNFEPRAVRGDSAVSWRMRGFCICRSAGGPEAAVKAWLAGLEGGCWAISYQKSLRQWKRSTSPAIAVLRCCGIRWRGRMWRFGGRCLIGQMCRICARIVSRTYKIDLPSCGLALQCRRTPDGVSGVSAVPEAEPCRANRAAGGCSIGHRRAAVLQGFAQFQGPDHVLREDRLAEGLGFSGGEVGVDLPPMKRMDTSDCWPTIYDAEYRSGGARCLCARLHGLWLWRLWR